MQETTQFASIATRQSVDAKEGIIRGVSVVTEGEATGHNLFIDSTTIKQVLDTASAYAGGLKVKVNHGKALESIVGVLKNFAIDGKQLRADLHLLKSSSEHAKIIEMAETMPEAFGLSLSFSNHPEEIEGKQFSRCAEIYSADLVDSPAANPSGLFSTNTDKTTNINIMSKAIALALSLPETATEEEIALALKTRLEANKPTDLSKVTADIEAAKTELATLMTSAKEASAAAKKTEISALVAEASRDGKVVPLTDVQLSKMDVADIKEMIVKLPKAQVTLARKPAAPVDKDGKELTRNSPGIQEFCRSKREEGAAALNALFHDTSLQN
jgi:hypothetical protein